MLKILKYWAGGLVIFLVIVFIIPENTDFVDKTILIDIPSTPVNIKNPIYLYNKNPIILKEKLSYYLKNKSNEKISIIVPRLEYFIYYFFFFFMRENSNYTLNVKTTKINLQLIFYYYHKTLIKFFATIYEYLSEVIKKKGKK